MTSCRPFNLLVSLLLSICMSTSLLLTGIAYAQGVDESDGVQAEATVGTTDAEDATTASTTTIETVSQEWSLEGFIDWMLEQDGLTTAQKADLENAEELLDYYTGTGEIDCTDPEDASAIWNIEEALAILADVDEARKSDPFMLALYDDIPDMITNFTMMVGSAYTANVSSAATGHVSDDSAFATLECLAWGSYGTDPLDGWIVDERNRLVLAMNTLGYSYDTLTEDQFSEIQSLGSSYGETGHYLAIIRGISSGVDLVTGCGYTTDYEWMDWCSSLNMGYATLSLYSGMATYSLDDFQDLLDEYMEYLESDATSGWNIWGSCEWQVDADGVLTVRPIGGTGVGVLGVSASSAEEVPWYAYEATMTKVVIEGEVWCRAASYGLFYSCNGITAMENSENFIGKNVTIGTYMFYNCTSLEGLDLSGFSGIYPVDIQSMFGHCSSITSLDLSGWDTSRAQWFNNLFYGCSSLESLDVSTWDLSSCSSLNSTFYGCSSLADLDVSDWDTSSVTTMYRTFYGCSSLTSLDLSDWDTSNVESMFQMFRGCSYLAYLDISGFDTSSCSTGSAMFALDYRLRTVVVGAKFGYTSNLVMPKNYDLDGDDQTGSWVAASDGTVYSTSSSLPTYVADTYYAFWPAASFGTVSVSANGCVGGTLSATVSIADDTAFASTIVPTYQWFDSSGSAVSSASTSSTLSITSSMVGGSYYCVVTDGSGTYTSSIASDTVSPAHTWGSAVVTTAATCTTAGIQTVTCSVCGETETQAIAALGHDYVATSTTDATCTDDGYVTYTCSRCDDSYTETTDSALGHDWGDWVSNGDGTSTRTCSRCGETQTTSDSGTVSYSIEDATITLSSYRFAYDGTSKKPTVTVVLNGITLVEGTDYNVYYYDNIEVGTATVEVEGEGSYTGLVTVTFRIVAGSLDGVTLVELYGSNRYITMEAIADYVFAESGCQYAVVATGANFPDALAAASLAGVLDAPVILVKDSVADDVVDELLYLGVDTAYVIGGSSAVSLTTETKIKKAGISTVRVSGTNRKETAVAIADTVIELSGSDMSDTCIVASGMNFPDALSASPYSYWSGSPIYLTGSGGELDDATLEAIVEGGYENIIVLGGTTAVSSDTFYKLRAISDVYVERIYGSNRYETSAAMAEWSVDEGMGYDGLVVATGVTFPDALAGSSLCGQNGSVILLCGATLEKSSVMFDVLDEVAGYIDTVYVLGGTGAVSQEIRDAMLEYF